MNELNIPVATYSILAFDHQNQEIGIGVQSHYFAVGALVPTAVSGVGGIITQSFAEPQYGRRSLQLMQQGHTPEQALTLGLARDRHAAFRQIGIMDRHGRIAAHTGEKCVPHAGHAVGRDFVCMANMMYKEGVWHSMGECFEAGNGELADRLLQALQAADVHGGDVRGKQAAAILVVKAQASNSPQSDRPYDLRVDDHPEPLKELERLLQLKKAYHHNDRGANHLLEGNFDAAHHAFTKAVDLAGDLTELRFWQAVALANCSQLEKALPLFREVFTEDSKLATLVDRLPQAGLLPDNPALIKRIRKVRDHSPSGMPKSLRDEPRKTRP